MAHFAELDEHNTVIQIIAVNNNELLVDGIENEERGIQFCNSIKIGRWIQTSYNATIRKRPAFVGGTYNAETDEFIEPQPFPSWKLDSNNDWQPPKPLPALDGQWIWDESIQEWTR